jgi:isopentenyl phosphate kinase
MVKADFVLKLGGSAITHKDAPLSPNIPIMEMTAKELAGADLCSNRMVLVYGGGSYGHYVARKHLSDGKVKSPSGIAEIRAAMISLTKVLTEVFIWQGVPIFCINPSGSLAFDRGRITNTECLVGSVRHALENGLLPAVGGDVVLDSQGGARIASGDLLARILAKRLGSKSLLFGTDVDGILGADGKLIRMIGKGELDALIPRIGKRKGDVTGGMAGKLAEIRSYIEEGGERAIVFNLAKEGRLSGIIKGKEVECTYIGSGDRMVDGE